MFEFHVKYNIKFIFKTKMYARIRCVCVILIVYYEQQFDYNKNYTQYINNFNKRNNTLSIKYYIFLYIYYYYY